MGEASATMQEDFSTVCRTCATVTEFVMPIFEGEGLQNNLADKIHKHLPIKVSAQDVLPLVVCYQCASTLLAWHELVMCSVQADAALRSRIPAPQSPQTLHTQENKPCIREIAQSSRQEREEKSKLERCHMLKQIVINYFPIISTAKEENFDMDLVCQKCTITTSSIPELAEHLILVHFSSTINFTKLERFVRNYITFEESLDSYESNRNSEIQSEGESPAQVLPTLLCPFCESVFSSSTRLVCHLNKHMEMSIEDGIICCDETFYRKNQFVKHLQEQHVNRSLNDTANVCRCCGFEADSPEDLQSHVSRVHDKTKSKKIVTTKEPSSKCQKYIPAVCPECNKAFSNKYNMFVHMNSHHSGKTFKYSCDKCNKTYSSRTNLRQHKELAHDGILAHLCSSCGEAFPSLQSRDIHMRIHSGDRPFTCPYCSNCYRAKNTLDRHIDMHLDIRNYQCHLCPKKFRKRSHLNYHIGTHKAKK